MKPSVPSIFRPVAPLRSANSVFRICLSIALLLPLAVRAHDASAEMAVAAQRFLAALAPEQKAQAEFQFADKERENWHFIPRARKGLAFKEMKPAQRLLGEALLASALSHRGYEKAVSIMSLEAILAEMEQGRGPARDPEQYFISIFGTPGKEPWGWRLEGHHLALNFTAGGGEAPSMTPNFLGSNPGDVTQGPLKGMRVLEAEEDIARALIKSFDAEQRQTAIILADAPKEVFNTPDRVDPTKPEGITAGKLTPEQNQLLTDLVKEYLFRARPDVAEIELATITKSGWDKITFAWAGGLERGEPHYYRVQGATFVLEYDNTQNNANHVHSLWRDFGSDFGHDTLGEHVKADHAQ
ncbi:MAG: DUF3500 domain-containing protein [Chthoniobacteraceae bacterium]